MAVTHKNLRIYRLPTLTLVLIVFLQLISHFAHSPLWLIIFVCFIGVFKLLAASYMSKQLPSFVRIVLVLGSSGFFFLYYRSNFTVDMAASFLLLSGALKLMELRTERETRLFVYVMLYLSCVSFLFEQGFIYAFVQMIIVLCCLYVLLVLSVPNSSGQFFTLLKGRWLSLVKLFIVALPLVIICFLFVPRMSPLWSIPIKNQSTSSGLSESMSPGDIAELAQSADRAFRVQFTGEPPPRDKRYWRGFILDSFDGREWKKSAVHRQVREINRYDPGHFFGLDKPAYQVMLEPSQQRFAFSLEGSEIASSNLVPTDMGVFNLKFDVIQATRYKMSYQYISDSPLVYSVPTMVKLNKKDRTKTNTNLDLQVPLEGNPKTQEFVRKIKQKYRSPEKILAHLLRNFNQTEFFYTLKPDKLGDDFVDKFLFETKKGFCSHFAGSLAYMLRLAGIPARVVIGYQGGEYNESSNYLILYQYDAHAWVEVKLPQLGWVRVDPTAMVSPERILEGLESAVGPDGGFLGADFMALAAHKFGILNWARLRLDELSYQWQKRVVNYNKAEQYNLILSIFGEFSYYTIAYIFVCAVVFFFVVLSIYAWLKINRNKYSYAEKKYIVTVTLLGFVSHKRQLSETPRAYLQRMGDFAHPLVFKVLKQQTEKLEQDEYY